jgi:hypothetical protein
VWWHSYSEPKVPTDGTTDRDGLETARLTMPTRSRIPCPPNPARRSGVTGAVWGKVGTMDRLSPLDALFIDAEDRDQHTSMAIASIAVVRGPVPIP